ncbi:phage Tail Collar [Candidatus Koribacter versatilis Ellin345]|uniref:Phage Tail Collar n=1 Tax=Koribacter versatilis (strain Ellin345) TaxID=204669 RepID=Q1INU6_KORVE|nr:tail fiber protein [Candidatus Koribacter versatilis]ABF41454.1 phage Tail Collar [Candidatus Koribacter versatilis Ellin345]
MSSPFVGEIRLFAGSFAPQNWAFCNGQLMAISENTTLFTLIGTTYGGDGVNTFGLPDLQGRVPIHQGSGFVIGQLSGSETVTVSSSQLPQHNHLAQASSASLGSNDPSGNFWASNPSTKQYSDQSPSGQMAGPTSLTGGNQPHDNMLPFLCVTYIIALFGIFPSQN